VRDYGRRVLFGEVVVWAVMLKLEADLVISHVTPKNCRTRDIWCVPSHDR
jgi:hypothetical protein